MSLECLFCNTTKRHRVVVPEDDSEGFERFKMTVLARIVGHSSINGTTAHDVELFVGQTGGRQQILPSLGAVRAAAQQRLVVRAKTKRLWVKLCEKTPCRSPQRHSCFEFLQWIISIDDSGTTANEQIQLAHRIPHRQDLAFCVRSYCRNIGLVMPSGDGCTMVEARVRGALRRSRQSDPIAELWPDGSMAAVRQSPVKCNSVAPLATEVAGSEDPQCRELVTRCGIQPLASREGNCGHAYCESIKSTGSFALLLNELGLFGQAVEVGTWRGTHAAMFLSRWHKGHLTLVDPYKAVVGSDILAIGDDKQAREL